MIALADCAVAVTDAKAAARWWNEKVGFAVHTVGNGSHAVVVAPPGDRFVIHLCEGFEKVDPGNTGIAFVSDDLEERVRRMEAAGVAFPEPLHSGDWGARAKFADPDGNIFWLIRAPTAFIQSEIERRAPDPSSPQDRRPAGPSGSTHP
jgi:predicted enzyme related to lactoylglutathione lyase